MTVGSTQVFAGTSEHFKHCYCRTVVRTLGSRDYSNDQIWEEQLTCIELILHPNFKVIYSQMSLHNYTLYVSLQNETSIIKVTANNSVIKHTFDVYRKELYPKVCFGQYLSHKTELVVFVHIHRSLAAQPRTILVSCKRCIILVDLALFSGYRVFMQASTSEFNVLATISKNSKYYALWDYEYYDNNV